MGTRADFYVGRGAAAEWIGSVAYDGYPGGSVVDVLAATTEDGFRSAVAERILDEDGTKPEMGWPWPWKNSHTTDYAYAWFDGAVQASSFGRAWWNTKDPEPDRDGPKAADVPEMGDKSSAPAGSARSGMMVFGVR